MPGPSRSRIPKIRREMAEALQLTGRPGELRRRGTAGACVDADSAGYRRAGGVYEFFFLSETNRGCDPPGVTLAELRRAAREEGWQPLRENRWEEGPNAASLRSKEHCGFNPSRGGLDPGSRLNRGARAGAKIFNVGKLGVGCLGGFGGGANIQHPTSNIQHSSLNVGR